MQASTDFEKKFHPITLNIKIENRRELELLWCMFNNAPTKALEYANQGNDELVHKFKQEEIGEKLSDIWYALNDVKKKFD